MKFSLVTLNAVVLTVVGLMETSTAFVLVPHAITKTTTIRSSSLFISQQQQKEQGQGLQGEDYYNSENENESPFDEEELDGSMGGSRLKQVMNAAKSIQEKQRRLGGAPPLNPFAPQPQSTTPPPLVPPPGGIDNLSTEEQAAMFRQMMAQQQQQQQQQPQPSTIGYPVPPPPPKVERGGVDAQGRKFGRNRDADAIANTSDLYFAQLKRDSSVRTLARYNDDEDVANNVMGDAGVDALNDQLITNPYLQRENRMDEDLLDNELFRSAKEQLIAQDLKEKLTDRSYSGVSYKEKLAALKNKNTYQNHAVAVAPATMTPSPQQQPKPQAAVNPIAVPAPPTPTPVVATTPTAPSPQIATVPKSSTTTPATVPLSSVKQTQTQTQTQTQPQPQKVTETKSVAVPVSSSRPAAQSTSSAGTSSPPPPPQPSSTAMSHVATAMSSDMKGAIDCVEGAVQMYKNSPPDLQKAMLTTLRAALISAVNTCNYVIDNDNNN